MAEQTESPGAGVADILGPPYTRQIFTLAADDEGEAVAVLVHRPADEPTGRAVLHVHGFADYFFQTVAADFWVAHGYDFYALDLRKYGRSLLPHQTPNFVTDLREYDEELDLAWQQVTSAHHHVVVSAHSTGGLTVPLWLHRRGHEPAGVFLNAPWIDMQGDALTRLFKLPVAHRIGQVQPKRELRRAVTGGYTRSLHRDYRGEWEFDLRWKPEMSWPVYAGWVRAIRKGQARLAKGLDVRAPVLMISSARSSSPLTDDDPDLLRTDTVLDVERLRRRVARISRHVTIVLVEGALHDVTLSPAPVRAQVFEELGRWLTAYVDQ